MRWPNKYAWAALISGAVVGVASGVVTWALLDEDPASPATIVSAGPVSSSCPKGYVALTYDLSLNKKTEVLKAALKKQGVQATFFVSGKSASDLPAFTRSLVADGHVVGNYTYDLPHMSKLPANAVKDQFAKSNAAFLKAGIPAPSLFRTPFGDTSPVVRKSIREAGMLDVGWTVDSLDWKEGATAQSVVKQVLMAQPGAVVVQQNQDLAVQALPGIVSGLKAKGMCVGRVVYSNTPQIVRPGWSFNAIARPW